MKVFLIGIIVFGFGMALYPYYSAYKIYSEPEIVQEAIKKYEGKTKADLIELNELTKPFNDADGHYNPALLEEVHFDNYDLDTTKKMLLPKEKEPLFYGQPGFASNAILKKHNLGMNDILPLGVVSEEELKTIIKDMPRESTLTIQVPYDKNKKIEIGVIEYLFLAKTIKRTERDNVEKPLVKIIRQKNGQFIINLILPKDYPVDL